jgi:CheY-like chemotaxis protein
MHSSAPESAVYPSRDVLIIEDNPDGRTTLRLLLELLGHHVEEAKDGVEGVNKALAHRPEIVLLDIGLPRLDGYQVARRLRAALGRDVILIAYTAYSSPEAIRRIQEAGFDTHLVKPVELSELKRWLTVPAHAASHPQAARMALEMESFRNGSGSANW